MEKCGISKSALGRIPGYLNYIDSLPDEVQNISATKIAKELGLGEIQVRKDLSMVCNTTFGAPKSIYVDDGGSAYTVFGNIIDSSAGRGLMIGGGSDNVIQNNILIGTRAHYDSRGYFGDWQEQHSLYGPVNGMSLVNGEYVYSYYWNHIYSVQTDEWDYELWNARLPYYSQLKSSNVKDLTDHYLLGVCGGAVVMNNAIVWECPGLGKDSETGYNRVAPTGVSVPNDDIANAVKLNGVFKDYKVYYTVDEIGFVDYEGLDLNLREDSKIYQDIPGFQPIPLDRIGCDFAPAK